MDYFKNCKDLQELKIEYKRLVKLHHPDKGGDLETMKAINAQYESMLENGNYGKDGQKFSEEELKDNKEYREILEKTVILEGIEIELAGRWLWFTGETYRHKETLKSVGCKFARKKLAWYWRPAEYKKSWKSKPLSLDQIRAKYGSKEIEKKHQKKLF